MHTTTNNFADLPEWAQKEIKHLRSEVAKHRTRARAAHAAVRQLEAVRAVLDLHTTQETK